MINLNVKKDLKNAEQYKNTPCSVCGLKSSMRYREIPIDENGYADYTKIHVLAACDNHLKDIHNIFKQKDLFPIKTSDVNLIKSKIRKNPISAVLRHEVFKRDHYRCLECGAKANQIRLHVDHIIAKSQGGLDELSNLQTLCEDCNWAKHNRSWRGGLVND